MSGTEDNTEKFTSHMLKALSALTITQLALMNAQTASTPQTEEIERAWELLWGNLKSVSSLATVIRASVLEHGVPRVDAQIRAALATPLVPPGHAEFRPLLEAIEESMQCAERMSQHTADAFEQLIYAGHGESDCALAVSMVRLYGHAAETLLETVRAELEPTKIPITN